MGLFKKKQKQFASLPKHIAFIMDGNGRWATKLGMPRTYGHKMGVSAIERVVDACLEFKIKVVSFFVFSTENWSRPKEEIDYIFGLAKDFFNQNNNNKYDDKNIKVVVSGNTDRLDSEIREIIDKTIEKTKNNDGLIVNFAINYGGRDEIVMACNKLIKKGKEATKEDFANELYTSALPDPDIVVRTSGEVRISNFMLYQMAYSELFFPKKYWPDFDKKDVVKILEQYQNRNRRFGKI